MATYAIGDIQGCFRTFERLLERIEFRPKKDRLWIVGDMVNRGPRSLDVVRWLMDHDDCCDVVLGNHDIHLLARAAGLRKDKKLDTIDAVLAAKDRDDIVDWVRRQPFLMVDEDNWALVHAGVLPTWSMKQAKRYAAELSDALAGDDWQDGLDAMYGKPAPAWRDDLKGAERLRTIAAAFTRMRVCSKKGGVPDYDFADVPERAPAGYVPWFEVGDRRDDVDTIVFGHWAALGLRIQPGIVATDTACVWGGRLTAVRLGDLAVFQEPAAD